MKNQKKILSLTLATAVAIAFSTAPILSTVAYAAKKVPCYGTSDKENGYVMKTAAECKKMGGRVKK